VFWPDKLGLETAQKQSAEAKSHIRSFLFADADMYVEQPVQIPPRRPSSELRAASWNGMRRQGLPAGD